MTRNISVMMQDRDGYNGQPIGKQPLYLMVT